MRYSARKFMKFMIGKPKMKTVAGNKMPPLPEVSQLVKLYQVKATKHLSQNFLYDKKIIDRFVSCIKRGGSLEGHHICEVGPGPGAITRSIMSRNPDQLMIIEKDQRFMNMLKYLGSVCDDRLHIVHGDILQFDLLQAFPKHLSTNWNEDSLPPFAICGNLPFNISLPLLFKLLNDISLQENAFTLGRIPMIFTFQHEVGERLTAPPGDHQRCRISVTSQLYCDVQYKFMMKRGSFVPSPKVDVAVVRLEPKKSPITKLPFKKVDYVVKHTMHNRNKNCRQGVRTLFPPTRDDLVEQIFHLSSVNPKTPGSKLENGHFCDLCHSYEEIAEEIPQLRLVDSYDPKAWLKHFQKNGEPIIVS